MIVHLLWECGVWPLHLGLVRPLSLPVLKVCSKAESRQPMITHPNPGSKRPPVRRVHILFLNKYLKSISIYSIQMYSDMNCGTHFFFKVRKKKRDAEELKPLGQDLFMSMYIMYNVNTTQCDTMIHLMSMYIMYNVNTRQCDTMIHPSHIRLRTASCRKVTIWPGPNKPIGFSNSST